MKTKDFFRMEYAQILIYIVFLGLLEVLLFIFQVNLKYDKESELFSYDIFVADWIDSGRSLFMPAVYEKISVL
mgnify:CR=1 FL=1